MAEAAAAVAVGRTKPPLSSPGTISDSTNMEGWEGTFPLAPTYVHC